VRHTLDTAILVWMVPLTFISLRSIMRTVYRLRTPWTADLSTNVIDDFEEPQISVDFYVPARGEPILYRTLRKIMELATEYPRRLFKIFVALGDGDPDTELLALQAQAEMPENIEVVTVDGSRRKPTSLNHVLFNVPGSGQWQMTLDAESIPAKLILKYLNTLILRHPEVGVWQFGVQLVNITGRTRRRKDGRAYPRWHPLSWHPWCWWQAHNANEYYVWFSSAQLHQVDRGYLTPGGNTLAIKREVLEETGGWPEWTLTEDAGLGMLLISALAKLGLEIRTFYLPELATREQTPPSLRAWFWQRVRWMQGFMEVKKKGDWRDLPTARQRLLAYETLSMPAFQAISGVMVPFCLATVYAFKAPMLVVMLATIPMVLTLAYVIVQVVFFRLFCRHFNQKAGLLFMIRFVLGIFPYQLMQSAAAMMAKYNLIRDKTDWYVTPKDGEHFENEEGELARVAA
jgi:cellulose synthase/poly-beta-1,6-N-acetylglucosamine synthase-like glycosyltransferase